MTDQILRGERKPLKPLKAVLLDRLWRKNRLAGPFVSLVILLLIWNLISAALPVFFPGPLETLKGGFEVAQNGNLFAYAFITLYRILGGWVIGIALGIPVGWMIAESDIFKRIVDPYVNSFRFIPPIIWVIVFIIWFGYNDLTRLLLVAYATFMVCVIHGTVGILSIPEEKLRSAQNLGAKGWELFLRVKVPASLPDVFTGLRVAMTNSFMTIIAVEMLTASSGIGYLAWTSRLYFRLDFVFVSIVVLGAMGWLTDFTFRWISRKYFSRYGVAFD